MPSQIPATGGSASKTKSFFNSLVSGKRKYLVLAVVIILGYFIYKHYTASASPTRYVLGQASTQTIVTSVSGTGQVSQDRTVNITPPGSGKLTSVNVKQGQQIKAGQTIAVLDETNNSIALNQARAGLASAQASYDQVMAGATTQSVQLAQLGLQSDQQALDNANTNLTTVTKQQNLNVSNAQSAYLNAGLEAIPNSGNGGTGTITLSGTYSGTGQGTYTITTYNTGGGLEYVVSGLETATGPINKTSPLPLGTKGLYMQFGGNFYNNDTWAVAIPNIMSSSYSSSYSAYQNALTTQSSSIASAQNQIQSAQNKLQQDQINLQVLQEPPTDQQAESAKASLLSAQSSLQNAEIAYQNNILTAPFDGQVAQLNNQAGDMVSPSTNVAVVVSQQSLAVISLNEVDVSKIKVGDKATMTFDAVDGLTITGTVAEIDNIGTVSQGVVNYTVKISFDTEDPRIKPGMSVNVSIITDVQADVLAVPNSAIQTQGAQNYVLTLDPSKTQSATGQIGVTSSLAPSRVMVVTGASDDTYTQITSGSLNAGDSIVTQTIASTAAKSTAATATSALRLGGGTATFGGGGGAAVRIGGGAGIPAGR
jgi:HlyD family secretion protein